MKLRRLLPILNTLFFAIVLVGFVQGHGGLKGDYTQAVGVTDAPTAPGDRGLLFFNRWQFSGNDETVLTKSFLLANIGGFGAAKAVLWALRNFFGEFRTMYPLGLSYASYSLLLGLPLSLLQWFGIGMLLDRFRWHPSTRVALTLLMVWGKTGTA